MIKFIFLIILILSGCANPKYWTAPATNFVPPIENANNECTIKLENSGLCVSWFWEIPPTIKNRATMILKTYRLNSFDSTLTPTDLAQPPLLIPSMPSMGHGTAKTITTSLDTGTFRISNISLYMTGEWLLKIIVKTETEKTDEVQFQINM